MSTTCRGKDNTPVPVRSSTGTVSTSAWREQGEQLRASLIKEDSSSGSQTFLLSNTCGIHRYYQVADQVRLLPSYCKVQLPLC
jgi:hypothetical protein